MLGHGAIGQRAIGQAGTTLLTISLGGVAAEFGASVQRGSAAAAEIIGSVKRDAAAALEIGASVRGDSAIAAESPNPPALVPGSGSSWILYAHTEDAPPPRRRRLRRAAPVPAPEPVAIPDEHQEETRVPLGPAPQPGIMGSALGAPVEPPVAAPVNVSPRVDHDDERDLEEVSQRTFAAERDEIAKVTALIARYMKLES